MALSTIADLRPLKLPRFIENDGALVVVESSLVPFSVVRVFTVTAQSDAVRGHHAHRQCSQFMYCPHGTVIATADDGAARTEFELADGNKALLVPPGIWLELLWKSDGATLTVLCDRPFEETDYVRDREEFLEWRRAGVTGAKP